MTERTRIIIDCDPANKHTAFALAIEFTEHFPDRRPSDYVGYVVSGYLWSVWRTKAGAVSVKQGARP